MQVTAFGEQQEALESLVQALESSGFTVAEMIEGEEALMNSCNNLKTDIVVMSVHCPDEQLLNTLLHMQHDQPRVVVLFSKKTTEQITDQVVKAGVAAYVVDGFLPARLSSIIDTAVLRFTEMQLLLTELEKTKCALADRKILDRAKGIIMQQLGCSEHEAYHRLRKQAMKNNRRLVEAAEMLIATSELFSGG